MSEPIKKSLIIFVYLILAAGALIVFWPVRSFDFINYDDNQYVYENPHVLNGLTRTGLDWAFTTGYAANWFPLTWLSLMLDCQLFGPNAGWMHLVNVFIHILSTLLLFAVLRKMTDCIWPSAFVAAAFAIHPMHVESVAWISERKDVLSTLFFMLTLLAYVNFVNRRSLLRYILTLVLFALGLMAKPMLVTLPFIMLLLDYWPLNRLSPAAIKTTSRQSRQPAAPDSRINLYQIIIEKIPFFALAVASSIITFWVQKAGGAVPDFNAISLENRIANAFLSYVRYINELFWPQNLAVFYPFSSAALAFWKIALCVLLLLAITAIVLRLGRTQKYLLVGWFWFVITLIPVIGLIQVGDQAYADRYSYIPYIGLFIIIAWGLPRLLDNWAYRRVAIGILMTIVLTALGISTYCQLGYWKNSSELFLHALAVTENNYLAHNNLAEELLKQGNISLAIEHCQNALRIRPDAANIYNHLGIAFKKQGRLDEADGQFIKAVQLKPDFAEAYYNLANTLIQQGRFDDAVSNLRKAVQLRPDWPAPINNLAFLIAAHPEIKGRDVNEAIRLAARACELTNYRDPTRLGTLAVAYASAGRFSEAIDIANKAIALADAANQPQIKNVIQYHLSFYTQGKPYIEPAPKSRFSSP